MKVDWEEEADSLFSQLSAGGRAMEFVWAIILAIKVCIFRLSDLAVFDGHLLTVDDRTGVIYRFLLDQMLDHFNVLKG